MSKLVLEAGNSVALLRALPGELGAMQSKAKWLAISAKHYLLYQQYHVVALFRSVQLHVSGFLPSACYEQTIKGSKWSYVGCR